ncbi:MAG: tRNA (adenosine(37)-N6)-dimethylallyltransferase MiaA [Chloroherpetonaceae bacterium]|nr:tRNA (adenosine(37)-N6)-dimethylallyltransferase MiaA [Chloroherpetonaceae bacterium]MDW8438635.1 tRNA (adenosine(37)-N6)-dimethylallyltransferase MiaA [Chloroherpetonaceae bacterium]
MKKVLVLLGATASGKTSMAIELALKFNAEIISADSRQIYRELSIGSAKPSSEELAMARHHFINEKDLLDDYDAASFAQDAWRRIADVWARGKNALVVGGSTLYLKSLVVGFSELPSGDDAVRARLFKELEELGSETLYERLKRLDPERAKTLDHTKTQRLVRSLEVIELSGRKMSELQAERRCAPPFEFELVGLDLPRERLYERINRRVDEMMRKGLLDEAKWLYETFGERRKQAKINALETVGYKELFSFLDGTIALQVAIDLVKQHTRNYAKRQLTFFRNQFAVRWIDASSPSFALNQISSILTRLT